MKTILKNEKFWGIELNEKVSNLVFYKEDYYWGRNPYYHKRIALFMMDGLYFKYSYSSSYNGVGASFGEISQKLYNEFCDELRSILSWDKDGHYDDGKSTFVLIDQPEGNFSAVVYPNECYSITHKGILAVCEEISRNEKEQARKKAEAEAARKKEYARECGKVARKLKISFVNVLRLGYEDEEKLRAFQDSLMAAKKAFNALSEEDRAYYEHEIFGCGRARMASALDALGVNTFGRDVRYMDFSELLKK